MKTSSSSIAQIKQFEGLRKEAYTCPAGVPTIGYGHTQGVHLGDKISESQADEYLRQDLREFEDFVDSLHLCINQNQFDALVDFAFNVGTKNLSSSTLLKKIRADAPTADIQAQFRRWCYAGKKRLDGLVRRRDWEATMWAKK